MRRGTTRRSEPTDKGFPPDPGGMSSGTTRTVALLAWLTVAGIVVYVVLDMVAQVLPPHYSALSQAESDLAVGPYGWIMTVNFVVRGVLSTTLLLALSRVLNQSRRARTGLVLLGVWTAGAFLLAAFPTDVGGGEHSAHGTIHLAVAFGAFVAIPIAQWLLAGALRVDPRWTTLGAPAMRAAILTIGTFVLLVIGAGAPRIGGLTERVFLGAALLWIGVVALGLLRYASLVARATPDAGGD